MTLPHPPRLLRFLAALALASAFVGPARAQLALKGALLFAEDFRRYETYTKEKLPVQEGWQVRVAHGLWTRTAEGVKSTETPGHQPVLVFEGDFGDCVIEVDFRYQKGEPGKWGACRISATNPALHPRAYAASVWANVDYKSRAVGLVLEHDEWSPGHITQVARKLTDFLPDTWYTLRLELIGNRALAECNGVTVTGEYPKFGLPKSSLWLATGLSSHELRRLRVYRATPNPAWPPKQAAESTAAPKSTP